MLRPIRPQTGTTAPEGWDREFYDYVMSLRLSGDLKYILVKQNSNGTSVSLNLQALLDSIPASGGGKGGGAEYNGYFKISQLPSAQDTPNIPIIRVSEGAAVINDIDFPYIPPVEFDVTSSLFIYLTAGHSMSPAIGIFTEWQNYEEGFAKILLGRIELEDGKLTIRQEHHGVVYAAIYGDCGEDN